MRVPSLLWPRTMPTCILLALFFWPVVMILTEALGAFIEPRTGIDDFGLAAMNFTMPLSWLFAIVLWFRGFLFFSRSAASVLFALAMLPFWFIFTSIITFLFFPFGRVNPNF
jgi:hypothetical protein